MKIIRFGIILALSMLIIGNGLFSARPVDAAPESAYCPWPNERIDSIAANAGISKQALLAYNGISRLEAGTVLRLPPNSIPPDRWTTPLPPRSIEQLIDGESGAYLGYDNRNKRVALTFDIGYNPQNQQIMDFLHERGIHATFFVLGLSVYNHPEIVTQIMQDGHELGALSWKHDDLTQMTPEQVKSEFVRTEKAIRRASKTATSRPFFRAPFGKLNPTIRQIASDQGYYPIGWTIDNQDWLSGATSDTIYDAVVNNLCPGAIIVMHGYRSNNWDALPRIIDYLNKAGYQIVALSTLFHQ